MSFVVSKLLWPLAAPAGLTLALLLPGVLLSWTRWWRAGRALAAAALLVALVFGPLPTGTLLLGALEDRFPPSPPPPQVDGIIVLGGAIDPVTAAARGQPALNDAAERLTAFVALARQYPQARLVFTGGSGRLLDQQAREAPVARALFAELGLEPERVLFESESRNTFENAFLSAALVRPQPGETWLLVTSAFHMPRAMGVFRRIGWTVVPYPVDYRTDGRSSPSGDRSAAAVHEWLGLIAYRLMGHTDAVFPAPR